MSFFLVRLLQNFSEFSLALDAQPKDSLPPASWRNAPGTKGRDRIAIALGLTMSVKVRQCCLMILYPLIAYTS